MSLAARHIDVSDENVPFEIAFRGPFNAGAKLFLKYAVDAVAQPEKELTITAGGIPTVRLDVLDRSLIEYQIIEREPGKQDRILTKKKREIADSSSDTSQMLSPPITSMPHMPSVAAHSVATPHTASATPAAAPTSPNAAHASLNAAPASHDATPGASNDPDAKVKEFSAKLLSALHNPDASAENVLAILEELHLEMEKRPIEVKRRLLASLSVALGNMASLSPVVRDCFKGKPPCTSVDEMMDRFEIGSDKYRHSVYLKMKADLEASQAFHIRPGPFDPEDPFHNAHLNRIFDTVCFKQDLGGRKSAARIGAALETIDAVSPTDPELDNERLSLLKPVLKRRALKKPGIFGSLRANKLDNLLHTAVQAGGLLTIAGGGWVLGAGIMAAPSLLEAFTGVKSQDVIRAMQNPSKIEGVKNLWKTFSKNFFLFDWIRSDKNALKVFSERAAHVLRNVVPVAGPLALRRDVSIGGYEEFGENEVVTSAEKRDRMLAALVSKFASGEGGSGAASAAHGAPAAPTSGHHSPTAGHTPPAAPAAHH